MKNRMRKVVLLFSLLISFPALSQDVSSYEVENGWQCDYESENLNDGYEDCGKIPSGSQSFTIVIGDHLKAIVHKKGEEDKNYLIHNSYEGTKGKKHYIARDHRDFQFKFVLDEEEMTLMLIKDWMLKRGRKGNALLVYGITKEE